MKQLIENVLNWADEKGILKPENSKKQYAKVIEEFGETCRAILRNDANEVKDGLGDLQVTIIIYSKQLGKTLNIIKSNDYGIIDTFDLIHELSEALAANSLSRAMFLIDALSANLGYTSEECLESAWNVIKNRKGVTVAGIFIKSDDLDSIGQLKQS